MLCRPKPGSFTWSTLQYSYSRVRTDGTFRDDEKASRRTTPYSSMSCCVYYCFGPKIWDGEVENPNRVWSLNNCKWKNGAFVLFYFCKLDVCKVKNFFWYSCLVLKIHRTKSFTHIDKTIFHTILFSDETLKIYGSKSPWFFPLYDKHSLSTLSQQKAYNKCSPSVVIMMIRW